MNLQNVQNVWMNHHFSLGGRFHDWIHGYSLVCYEYSQTIDWSEDPFGWGDAQFQRMYCQIGRYPLLLNVFQGIEIEIEIDHGVRGGDNNHIHNAHAHVHVHAHVHSHTHHGYGLKSCTNSHRCWRC